MFRPSFLCLLLAPVSGGRLTPLKSKKGNSKMPEPRLIFLVGLLSSAWWVLITVAVSYIIQPSLMLRVNRNGVPNGMQ